MIARSFRRLAAVSLTGAAFLAAPASAQTRDEAVAWCLNKQHTFTPELVVRGCTSLLQVRNAPANIAAEAYRLRADAYYDQKDYARANADYDQALRLDPGNTLARNNREALLQGTRSTVGAAPQVQVAAGDGSIAGAIMIQATSENAGVDAETQWLKRNLPGWADGYPGYGRWAERPQVRPHRDARPERRDENDLFRRHVVLRQGLAHVPAKWTPVRR
jgi:tetratricopeptide (TPR) repeat protein